MEPVQDGMNLDPETLIQVQQNYIASARIKEVQLEAAVMQLNSENQQLKAQLAEATAETAIPVDEEAKEG